MAVPPLFQWPTAVGWWVGRPRGVVMCAEFFPSLVVVGTIPCCVLKSGPTKTWEKSDQDKDNAGSGILGVVDQGRHLPAHPILLNTPTLVIRAQQPTHLHQGDTSHLYQGVTS